MDFSNPGSLKLKEFNCEEILVKHKCKYCDFTNDLWSILNDHIRRLHKTSLDYRSNLQIKLYVCSNCDFMSYSILVWISHKNKCTYVSEDENKHSVTSWRYTESGSRKQEITRCKYFHNKSYRKYVESNHSREVVWFECSLCEYKAKQKGNLKRHIVISHADPKDIKWYECDRCYYKTKAKSDLQKHINIKHLRENLVELKCSQCIFKTVYKNYLKMHINMLHAHVRETQFKCSKCFFETAYKNSLKSHMNARHADPSEIRWFECSQCEYKAKIKPNLDTHIKRKHAPGNLIHYECHHCSYKTTFKKCLEKHIVLRHTLPEDTNWLKCDLCKYKAKLKCYLQKHIKNKHGRGFGTTTTS